MLWASIVPAQLDAVGTATARPVEVPFVSATTGLTDLMATLVCHDTADLHTYPTRFASFPGIRATETMPLTPLIHAVRRSSPAEANSGPWALSFGQGPP